MRELAQRPGETPRSWLTRLASAGGAALPLADQRAWAAYMAEARRLLQDEQQRAKWDRGKR
jgi:hypothetical protein